MSHFSSDKSNYDKHPFITVDGYDSDCYLGWNSIGRQLRLHSSLLKQDKIVLVAECYAGIFDETVLPAIIRDLQPDYTFLASDSMKTPAIIDAIMYPDVTDDEVFGYLTRLNMADLFYDEKLCSLRDKINRIEKGLILIYGTGASLIGISDLLVYLDMPRWEGQMRFRKNQVSNIGVENRELAASLQYKRAFFVDWRVCDRLKKSLLPGCHYVIDTVVSDSPIMITGNALRAGLEKTVTRPFRLVPFFDPGPWGGQWMKEVCGLDPSVVNYAWCFDCVPEENSLLLKFGEILFEMPAINLVFFKPEQLLGNAVYGRFGDEFPIRFDLLDTMEGGNLSLQVHPLTGYTQEKFGMHYTQDESYYILDVAENAHVYLGLQDNVQPQQMMLELSASVKTGIFDVEKHVKKWQVRKHDHVLIPSGTVHCSGANSMVLEISATPYIFTFKLWDWGRLGLDGRPRPINIERGKKVIQWNRNAAWAEKNVLNQVQLLEKGDGWTEERTGLHELEFIETRRHWFTKTVTHHTKGIFNVLNLVEGREAIVESPDGQFDPFIVHYAETFIVPAFVKKYTIRPYGESEGKQCGTIKAFVRTAPVS
jgi:mannose-6-phosphate isomerase class I